MGINRPKPTNSFDKYVLERLRAVEIGLLSGKPSGLGGSSTSVVTVSPATVRFDAVSNATQGSVMFAGSAFLAEDNTNLFWDDSNDRLGIGTASPATSLDVGGDISISGSNNELRFYEAANYVGFEAPALTGDQIWVLPAADGAGALTSDGAGNLSWAAGGGGNTLDGAYDEGGAGVGRTITADTGSVTITSPDTANNACLFIDQDDVTNNPHGLIARTTGTNAPINVRTSSAGWAIDIEEDGGTSEAWQIGVNADGDLLFHDSKAADPAVQLMDGKANQMRIFRRAAGYGNMGLVVVGGGVGLSAEDMNNSSADHTTALMFGSTDPNFSTRNPKYLAGIVGRATENYAADTDSGMNLDFFVTGNNEGASPTPTVMATLGINGMTLGGVQPPSAPLEVTTDGSDNAIWFNDNTASVSKTWQWGVDSDGIFNIKSTDANTRYKLYKDTARLQVRDVTGGNNDVTQSSPGLLLTAVEMNSTSNEYTPGVLFGSEDTNFTTTNPKFLAGIFGVAGEPYSADTDSAMSIDFHTTPANDGTAPTPAVRMRIAAGGQVGIGTGTGGIGGQLETNATTASSVGLVVQTTDDDGTENLVELQNAAGTSLFSVEPDGGVLFSGSGAGLAYAGIYVKDSVATVGVDQDDADTLITQWTTDTNSNNCTAASASNKITITAAGVYLVTFNAAVAISAGAAVSLRLEGYLDGSIQANLHAGRSISSTDIGSMSFSTLLDVASVPVDLDIRANIDSSTARTLTVQDAQLNVVMVGGT